MSRLTVALALALAAPAAAQPFVRDAAPFPVTDAAGRPVAIPFAGGFFEPRPALADLTGDSLADLVVNVGGAGLQVFERVSGVAGFGPDAYRWTTDQLGGIEPGSWFLLGDLDGDGLADLLTRGQPGRVRYHRNTGTAAAPRFTLAADELPAVGTGAPGSDVLAVEDSSVPDLADVTGDGRPDLLAGKADMGTITLYENLGPGPDGLPRFRHVTDTFQDIMIYESDPRCTAGFGERPGAPGEPTPGGGRPSARHGANALAFADLVGAGRPSLFWGDFFTPSLIRFDNAGTATAPAFLRATDRFPEGQPLLSGGYNVPAFGDADGDGTLDLVVGVQRGLCFDRRSATANLLAYENAGTPAAPDLRARTTRLIETLDVGTRSTAALADLDGDGRADLLVGNEAGTGDTPRARLQRYRNTGTAAAPAFALADDDFLALDYDYGGYAPAVGDLTGDGLPDLLVGGFNGRFAFFRNTGTRTAPAFTRESDRFENVDAGQYARAALGDVDGDGRLDLVTGASSGRLRVYRNVGTRDSARFETKPNGQPTDADHAWGLAAGLPETVGQDAAPALADLDGDGLLDLVVGTAHGALRVFRNTGTPAAPQWAEAEAVPAGRRRTAPAVADLDGDGRPEIVAGTDAGGLLFWRGAGAPW